MAFRIASILGLSCRPWLVLGAAETEREFFPLSGGIDNGVQVTIKVASIKEDGATIEFVNRERKPAFTFTVNKNSQPPTITRSASPAFNGVTEDFGGFPAELSVAGPYTFIFTKRKFDMAVSIVKDGTIIRYPWYDYANLQEDGASDGAFPLLTHVAVNDVFTDPEVTLERPACSKKCHPDECRDAAGTNTCAAESCFSVEVGEAMGVATQCSPNQETTPGGSMHCCDGEEVTPKARTTLSANPDVWEGGAWATLSSNPDYIQRICTAFAIESCPTALAGTNVRVDKKWESSDGSDFELFTPAQITIKTEAPNWKFEDLAPKPFVNFSRFALFELLTNKKVTQELPLGFVVAGQLNSDSVHENIILAGEGSNLTRGQYVHVLEWTWNTPPSNMSTRYTRRVKEVVTFQSDLTTVYASAIPIKEKPVCTSRTLRDINGDDCQAYADLGLCRESGYPTFAGCKKWWPDDPTKGDTTNCRMPEGSFWVEGDPSKGNITTSRDAAALACCNCGGGDNEVPTNWGSDSASQLNIVM